jgi:hypothetical protein
MAYQGPATWPFPFTAKSQHIQWGDSGNYSTLRVMRRLARQQCHHPVVRARAAFLTMDASSADHAIQSIRSYMAGFPFVEDPEPDEVVWEPQLLIRAYDAGVLGRQGNIGPDCDDQATLGAALGMACGFQARFVAIAFVDKGAPLSHVYTELSPDGVTWTELDSTRPAQASLGQGVARSVTIRV